MHDTLKPDKISVAVDAVILTIQDDRLNLLLSRRTAPPYQGCWALPGRFVAQDEDAEKTVKLLLQEMVPVTEAYLEQLYTFSAINRDPRGRVISIAYLAVLPGSEASVRELKNIPGVKIFSVRMDAGGLTLTAADGTEETVLSGNDLAFDHADIVETSVARLRGKIDYTDIAFRFLADQDSFSMGELQTIFEAVTGKPADSSNFRRMIRNQYEKTGLIIRTEREDKRGPGRPSALYKFRSEP